jgi:hypothetical protein
MLDQSQFPPPVALYSSYNAEISFGGRFDSSSTWYGGLNLGGRLKDKLELVGNALANGFWVPVQLCDLSEKHVNAIRPDI